MRRTGVASLLRTVSAIIAYGTSGNGLHDEVRDTRQAKTYASRSAS